MADNPTKDLTTLGELINKLQVAYEQFFSGGARKEPLDLVTQAESIIRLYSQYPPASPTLQFRLASLQARYNSFRSVWERRKRLMEGGPTVKAWGVEPREGGGGKAPAADRSRAQRPQAKEKGEEGYRVVLSAGGLEDRQVQELYDRYLAARRSCNEPVDKVRLENFKAVLGEQLLKLRDRTHCEAVLVKVEVQGNKSRISAKPLD